MVGKTLSHYKILDKIGAGGMGEVYRAEDLRLHRQVAVKMLPDLFAGDPERLARFEREAKLLAALSHPNIAAIYGLEEAEGKRFLVLELVEGETLAQRLGRGPLPVDEALEVCRQIAEGLEVAHEKSIVHRDLKPSNIKLTPEGKVKILDFGLARAFLDRSPVGVIVDSPTITAEMTQPGVILGTAAYMSPEHAKGKPVDKRADIWAFGCILFECLTGKTAFPGETITEVLAAVLKGEPDWDALPKDLPANVRAVLRRCLQKDRNVRFHEIADARIELFEAPGVVSTKETVRRFPWIWVGAVGAVVLLAGVLIGRLILKSRAISAPLVLSRTTIKVEPGYSLDGMRRAVDFLWPTRTAMVLSSDGRFVVYCAVKDDGSSTPTPGLFLRRLDELEAKPIRGAEGGTCPVLSPDDKWICFYAEKKLRKVPVEGGVAQDICEVSDAPYGINWAQEGFLNFSKYRGQGLLRVSADGGTPVALTHPDQNRKEFDHRLPSVLPRGKGALFTIMAHEFDILPSVAVLDFASHTWKVLFGDGSDARYVPTGHLVFLRQGKLMAVPFDLDKLEANGQPVPVIETVMHALNSSHTTYNSGAGQFSISSSGSLIYVTGGTFPYENNSMFWLDQKGNAERVGSLTGSFLPARISPDGKKIVYASQQHLWIYDLERGIPERLTSSGRASFPVWTPDGKRLFFVFVEFGPANLFWMPVDGSSGMEKLRTSEFNDWSGSWSPDGEIYAFVESRNNFDIFLFHLKDRSVTPFATTSANEMHAEFSPDGKWLAYTSNELGTTEVFVRAVSGGRALRISPEGGTEPLWGASGRRIYFRKGNGVFALDILRTDPDFAVSKPRLLFEQAGYVSTTPTRSYDMTRDEQRFLMIKREERKPQPVTEMILIQNWFEELNRLCPVKK